MSKKRLYKSKNDRAIFGVCGGIGEYFDVDSIIIRLLFVLLTIVYGSGIVFYLIAAMIIPKDRRTVYDGAQGGEAAGESAYGGYYQGEYAQSGAEAQRSGAFETSGSGSYVQPEAEAAPQDHPAAAAYGSPGSETPVSGSVAAATAAMQQLTRQLNGESAAASDEAQQAPAEENAKAEQPAQDAAFTAESGGYTAKTVEAEFRTEPEKPQYSGTYYDSRPASHDRYDRFKAIDFEPGRNAANTAGGSYHEAPVRKNKGESSDSRRSLIGIILIVAGVIAILKVLVPWINFKVILGIVAILIGVYLIAAKK